MGENQGMIWIILGVIIVAAVLFTLGNTMSSSISETSSKIDEKTSEQMDKVK